MARSKVPSDPTTSPELRRFFDDLAREGKNLADRLEEAEAELAGYSFASEAEAEAGSSTTKWMSPRRTYDSILELSPFLRFIHLQDQKSDGTDGGTFTSGAWQTRTLNTTVSNTISGASLSANSITLPAGVYYVDAKAVAHTVQRNQLRFYNATDTAAVLYGMNAFATTSNNATPATVRGLFSIAGTKLFELQHQCGTTASTTGFGFPCTFGVTEVYADAIIWKLTE
jgi:hypothetical protein